MKALTLLLFILCLLSCFRVSAHPDTDRELSRIGACRDNDSAISAYGYLLQNRMVEAPDRVKILNLLGQRYFAKGDDRMMIRYMEQSCREAYGSGQNRQLAALYNNLGIGYQSAGLYDSAMWYYQRSIAASVKYGATISTAKPWLNLGLLYNRLKRYSPAIEAYHRTWMIAEAGKDTALLAACWLNLGALYAGMNVPGSFAKAEGYLSKALKAAMLHGFRDIEHKASYSLGLLQENKGQLSAAARHYEAARHISMGDYDDGIPLLNLGHVYLKMGMTGKARQALDSGMAIALRMQPAPDYLCDFYLYYAQLYRVLKRPALAASCYEKYIDLSDSLRGAQTQARIDQLQREYESGKRDNELIKKELVISRQTAALQHKNMIVYVIITLAAGGTMLLAWYGRRRRRRQRIDQEKAVWIAAFEGEERERQRISRELHDGIGGALSNARRWFATIGQEHPQLMQQSDYGEALQLLDGTLSDVRQTAHRLMPQLLLRHGLVKAVESYCEQIHRAASRNIEFEYLGYIGDMGHRLHLMVYRCIQELLENAVRHSGATAILVQLSGHENHLLQVTVEDNGNGINPTAADEGIGMAHITRGIEHIGGKVDIRSALGKGTSVTFEINYSQSNIPLS